MPLAAAVETGGAHRAVRRADGERAEAVTDACLRAGAVGGNAAACVCSRRSSSITRTPTHSSARDEFAQRLRATAGDLRHAGRESFRTRCRASNWCALCREILAKEATRDTIGVVLMHHGLFTFGDTAKISYERMIDLVSRAERHTSKRTARAESNGSVQG